MLLTQVCGVRSAERGVHRNPLDCEEETTVREMSAERLMDGERRRSAQCNDVQRATSLSRRCKKL